MMYQAQPYMSTSFHLEPEYLMSPLTKHLSELVDTLGASIVGYRNYVLSTPYPSLSRYLYT